MLTARSATDEKIRLLDLGADDYLMNPFAFSRESVRCFADGQWRLRRSYAS